MNNEDQKVLVMTQVSCAVDELDELHPGSYQDGDPDQSIAQQLLATWGL